ncbi:undecaprenyl-diphosphate phosphatase [Nanoarchaeota archaeon]
MINIIQAIFLAIIQGITEWLPISSSGHLAIVEHFLNITAKDLVFFNVMLHFGTVLVIILVFRKEIINLLKSLFSKSRDKTTIEYKKMFYLLILASIPIALIGFFFYDFFENAFSNMILVAIALIITGLILYSSKLTLKSQKKKSITILDSIFIGIAQALAVMPGISRSGATISTALIRNIDRQKAATFSFLLAIPAILGATAFQLYKGIQENQILINQTLGITIIGVLVSFMVGYISLTWLLKIIKQGNFHYFSYYCWVIGLLILIISIF